MGRHVHAGPLGARNGYPRDDHVFVIVAAQGGDEAAAGVGGTDILANVLIAEIAGSKMAECCPATCAPDSTQGRIDDAYARRGIGDIAEVEQTRMEPTA